jgi:hypothetical protein
MNNPFPVEIVHSRTNPSLGGYLGIIRQTTGFLQIFNIENDSKEQVNVAHLQDRAIAPYIQLIPKYQ